MDNIEKIKFPKYERGDKASSKLDDLAIKEMIVLRTNDGWSYQRIANLFNIHCSSAWFAINKVIDPEKLDKLHERNNKYYELRKDTDRYKLAKSNYYLRNMIERKRELNQYSNYISKRYYRRNRVKILDKISKSNKYEKQ